MRVPLYRRNSFARAVIPARRGARGFTLIEVLISAMLIAMGLASIVTLSSRSARAIRTSRAVSASSLILQQRVEMVRERAWPEVSSSAAVRTLMQTPTASEPELAGFQTETLTVTVPEGSTSGLKETGKVFVVTRNARAAYPVGPEADFSQEPTLFFEGKVEWRDDGGLHQRTLRTIVCRNGLTRYGMTGTVIGRPGSYTTSQP